MFIALLSNGNIKWPFGLYPSTCLACIVLVGPARKYLGEAPSESHFSVEKHPVVFDS